LPCVVIEVAACGCVLGTEALKLVKCQLQVLLLCTANAMYL
jgi:hypothetical protein